MTVAAVRHRFLSSLAGIVLYTAVTVSKHSARTGSDLEKAKRLPDGQCYSDKNDIGRMAAFFIYIYD